MRCKNTARLMSCAVCYLSVLWAASVSAQEQIGGKYYPDCGPEGGPAQTIETDNHLRITVKSSGLIKDEAYRTDTQVFEGELPSMKMLLCDDAMKNCKSVEGILTAYSDDGDTIEAAIEYFDGTETQGDAESVQGHMNYLKVQRDKVVPNPKCR